jgi:hypothetical protein
MEYQDRAPTECYDNTTDSIQLYIILAKRIQAANNQTITEADLVCSIFRYKNLSRFRQNLVTV